MQRALVYRWKAYNQLDVEEALQAAGIEVFYCDIPYESVDEDPAFSKAFLQALKQEEFSFVFSINYFTIIANCCEKANILYVSWACDSRLLTMQNKSVFHKTNRIFLFDQIDYAQYKAMGARVYYLPLAANVKRLQSCIHSKEDFVLDENIYRNKDISFVGSLYQKKNEYDVIYPYLTKELQDYFDFLLLEQLEVYNRDIIEEKITPDIMLQLVDCLKFEKARESFSNLPLVFQVTYLGFKLANMERVGLLKELSRQHKVYLFGNEINDRLSKVHFCGPVNYWNEMPKIFASTKINLNSTMHNIRTGLPLRIFDIMGSGGFLLTNFQGELPLFFEADKDMVFYDSFLDCQRKADYYLNHEEERQEIAHNGFHKIKEYHTYEKRMEIMLEEIKNSR